MIEYLNQNQQYIVLLITLIVWAGIVWYLVRLEKKIDKLEKQVKKD
jgi:CcmD family protein